jgi:hypothetical protein
MSLFDDIDAPDPEVKTPVPAPRPEIRKIRYTHDAVIDEIIAFPAISQGELSQKFGFTQSWMSIIINSDAFQERLAERKAQLVDPRLIASIEDRLGAVAQRSLDKIMEKLDGPGQNGIKMMELVAIAKLGVGDRNITKGVTVQNNSLYVVNLPPTAPDAKTWVKTAQGRKADEITDARVYD